MSLGWLNGWTRYVAHFAAANFVGDRYVDLFGGRQKFAMAGFASCEPHGNGLLVTLPYHDTREKYVEIRDVIERCIAGPARYITHKEGFAELPLDEWIGNGTRI